MSNKKVTFELTKEQAKVVKELLDKAHAAQELGSVFGQIFGFGDGAERGPVTMTVGFIPNEPASKIQKIVKGVFNESK